MQLVTINDQSTEDHLAVTCVGALACGPLPRCPFGLGRAIAAPKRTPQNIPDLKTAIGLAFIANE